MPGLLMTYPRGAHGEPVVGPYALKWYDPGFRLRVTREPHRTIVEKVLIPSARGWRVQLTDEGSAFLAEWFERYPRPIGLLKTAWPKVYGACQRAGLDDEDVNAACCEGIVRGVIRYDPERSAITTAMTWSVRGSVTDMLRVNSRHNRETLSSFCLADDFPVEPIASEPTTDASELTDLLAVMAAAKLTDRERHVLLGRFQEDATQTVIAKHMQLSKERVRQLEVKALDKLRSAFGVETDASKRLVRNVAMLAPRILALLAKCGPLGEKTIRARLRTSPEYLAAALRMLAGTKQVVLRATQKQATSANGRRYGFKVWRVHLVAAMLPPAKVRKTRKAVSK